MTLDAPEPFHQVWPTLQVMALPARRLVYLPIAKNACTSLKTLMVELSDLPGPRRAEIARDVHRITDDEETGLQLKDLDEATARALLAEDGILRFAVLRNPADRLVSAYVEKFVVRRARKRIATAPVLAAVRGVASPTDRDFAEGIRFREFLEHVLSADRTELDPHWRDQTDSFVHFPATHLYAIEDLDLLAEDLAAHLGAPVRIGRHNRARRAETHTLPGAAERMPADLPDPERLSPQSFLDAANLARLRHRFAADQMLYDAARREAALRRQGTKPPTAATPRPWRKRLSLNGLRRALDLP
ncbi:MAG: sulfotransferase family 2 domain-containing protein [Pseudomonadota bacterium]